MFRMHKFSAGEFAKSLSSGIQFGYVKIAFFSDVTEIQHKTFSTRKPRVQHDLNLNFTRMLLNFDRLKKGEAIKGNEYIFHVSTC